MKKKASFLISERELLYMAVFAMFLYILKIDMKLGRSTDKRLIGTQHHGTLVIGTNHGTETLIRFRPCKYSSSRTHI